VALARKIMEWAQAELNSLDPKGALTEIRSYNAPPAAVYQCMAGVLCVLGRKKRDVGEWKYVRAMLKSELLDEMQAFDPAKKGRKRCWNESKQVTKGLDIDTIAQKASVPVQVMYKWLEANRAVHKIVQTVRKREAAEAADMGIDEQYIVLDRIRVKNVPDSDATRGSGSSDPYVVFKVTNAPPGADISSVETKFREDASDPSFDGECLTIVLPAGFTPEVKVQVFDRDWGKDDDLLASASFVCSKPEENVVLENMKVAEEVDVATLRGPVTTHLSYQLVQGPPPTPPATVLVLKKLRAYRIPNLDAIDKGGTAAEMKAAKDQADPYVKIICTDPAEDIVETTEFIKNAPNPEFPEVFRLELSEGSPRPIMLTFQLYDKDFKNEDDLVASFSTPLSTAPSGQEKLFLTLTPEVAQALPAQLRKPLKFEYQWYFEDPAQQQRPSTTGDILDRP